MNKKGFTLVEVLAIITIISLIAVIVLPNIGGSIESKKEKELNNIISMIENSGKTYFSFNSDEYKVDINKLINEEYIVNDLLNPITNEKMEGCVRKILDKENVYQYTFGNCSIIEVPFKAELNGGTPSQSFNTKYDEGTIIELKNPTKENSDFKEWKLVKGNSILNGNKLTIGTTDTEIYAMYESWPTLEVDLNGGSDNVDYKEYYKSGSVIELEVPTKTGYTFNGWTLKSGNGIISGNTFTMGTKNTVLMANYNPNTNIAYIVKHWTQNIGASTTQNNTNYTLNSTENKTGTTATSVTPAVKTITGFTAPSTQTKTILGDGSLVVNYYYTRNSYTYTLGSKTGVSTTGSSATGSYQYGATITLKATAKTGYTWSKWTSSNTSLVGEKTTANTTFTMPAGNITITPNVIANTYTISYNANGGSGAPSSQTKNYGVALTLSSTTPTRTGYKFLGWSQTSSATSATYAAGASYTANESITLYAVWALVNPVTAYSCANAKSGSSYVFTYTGNCSMINDGSGNWRVKFLTSGTFKSTVDLSIDVFLVGGGGGASRGGGGGGYTKTVKKVKAVANTTYTITIGPGGAYQAAGGTTSAFNNSVSGGQPSTSVSGGKGGSGGGAAGYGSIYASTSGGSNGASASGNGYDASGGAGQGTTTREFGESSGTLYAGGGGGGGGHALYEGICKSGGAGGSGGGGAGGTCATGSAGVANTGGGGGGNSTYHSGSTGTGGSGIVVIRNAR